MGKRKSAKEGNVTIKATLKNRKGRFEGKGVAWVVEHYPVLEITGNETREELTMKCKLLIDRNKELDKAGLELAGQVLKLRTRELMRNGSINTQVGIVEINNRSSTKTTLQLDNGTCVDIDPKEIYTDMVENLTEPGEVSAALIVSKKDYDDLKDGWIQAVTAAEKANNALKGTLGAIKHLTATIEVLREDE